LKITGARIKSFLARPDAGIAGVLIYGPDQGLVVECAEILAKAVVDDSSDPFQTAEITGAALKQDPARLADEAGAISLASSAGSRRLVRLRQATDAIAPVIEGYLAGPAAEALVVAEAGILGPRSKLRRLFEKAKNAATLACYEDDERSLGRIISETLSRHGLVASPDARAFLSGQLGSNRGVTRAELEKLALYMGRPGRVELDDAMAVIGDSASTSIDAVAFAAASGDAPALDKALGRAFGEGAHPVTVLRAAARHIMRLHRAAGLVAAGMSRDDAVKALRPPVIFLHKKMFMAQLRQWGGGEISRALDILLDAELDCKTTAMPANEISGRALLRIGQAARAANRRPPISRPGRRGGRG
jgi:DNA polymerase-3 subunit delta